MQIFIMNEQLKAWLKYVLNPERLITKTVGASIDLVAYLKNDLLFRFIAHFMAKTMYFLDIFWVPATGGTKFMWKVTDNPYITVFYMMNTITYIEFYDFCTKLGIPFAGHKIEFLTDDVKMEINVTVASDIDELIFERDARNISTDCKEKLNIIKLYNKLCLSPTQTTSN
jgi:hypothetical protein